MIVSSVSPLDPSRISFIHVGRDPHGSVGLVAGQATHEATDYLAEGATPSQQGEYLRWRFDPATVSVTIENSRYGMFPCYYHQSSTDFIASSSIVPIAARLASSLSVDDDALALLLRFPSLIAADTPFKEIRALLPDSRLTWSPSSFDVEVRPRKPTSRVLSRIAAIDEFNERFHAAMRRRRMETEYVLPLTAGRDSRNILFELLQAGDGPTRCLTRGPTIGQRDDDSTVASDLCARFALAHDMQPITRPTAVIAREKNLATSFVTLADHMVVMEVALDLVRHALPVYDGIGGDVMMQGKWLTPERWRLLRMGDVGALVDDLLVPEEWVTRFLSRAARRRWTRERAATHLRTEFNRHLDEPNALSAFAFANYTRRGVGSYTFGMLGQRIPVACPYLDVDVHEFLASLDGDLFVDGTFHTTSIGKAFPQWSDIPYERPSGLTRSFWRNRRYAITAVRQALLHARGAVSMPGILHIALARLVKGDDDSLHSLIYLGQLFQFARGEIGT